MSTSYREADGGFDVLKDGDVVGSIPAGHPLAEQILAKVDKGEVEIDPAIEAQSKVPADEPIGVDDVMRALEAWGVLTREQVLAARRGK